MNRRRYIMTASGHSSPPQEYDPVTVAYIDFTQEAGTEFGGDVINGGHYSLQYQVGDNWINVPAIGGGAMITPTHKTRLTGSGGLQNIPTPESGSYQIAIDRLGNSALDGAQQEVEAILYNDLGEVTSTATVQDTQIGFSGEYTLEIHGLEIQCPLSALEVYFYPVQGSTAIGILYIRRFTLDYLREAR